MRLENESSVSLSQCLCCGSYDIVRQSWLRVSRNVVCFSSKSRHRVSVVSLLQRKRLCQAFLCEDSVGLTCFAPAQRARSHKTSRLSGRSFHGVRSRTIVTHVQAEVQAAFDHDTFGFCCHEDRIYCCDLLSQSMRRSRRMGWSYLYVGDAGNTTLTAPAHLLFPSLPGPVVGEMPSAARFAAVGFVGRPLTHVVRDAFCEEDEGIAEVREQHK